MLCTFTHRRSGYRRTPHTASLEAAEDLMEFATRFSTTRRLSIACYLPASDLPSCRHEQETQTSTFLTTTRDPVSITYGQ